MVLDKPSLGVFVFWQNIKFSMNDTIPSRVINDPAVLTTLLSAAKVAAKSGKRQYAHRLTVQATQIAPREIETWLWRAETADALPEILACLSRVLLLDPKQPRARRRMYEALQRLLRQNAFLGYVGETDLHYQVRTDDGQSLAVPKGRAVPAPYPPLEPTPLQPTYRWLGWALVGLLLAGLGTLVCAPVAAAFALYARQHSLSQADRVRAEIALWGAAFLWCCALPLSFLFLIHLL
jgi:hypothetical protein